MFKQVASTRYRVAQLSRVFDSFPSAQSGIDTPGVDWTAGQHERKRITGLVGLLSFIEMQPLYDVIYNAQVNYTNGSTWEGLRTAATDNTDFEGYSQMTKNL
jgi:hypothetical protein